jgi:Poly(ADP-ribose) polymerase and DNA-Ligase Zn-finger region
MPHVLELASTGRAKCRGCGEQIAAKTLRLGERVPNPFSDDGGETTHWYHPACGAFRRPEAFIDALATTTVEVEHRAVLEQEAALGVAHHRVPRVSTASLAPTGRATCRGCKEAIAKDTWRIALLFYEDGRFVPSGFVHASCASSYLETVDLLPRLRHFSQDLTEADIAALAAALS